MAGVILPLLPAGPFGPAATIKPRLLWALVLFFSALSFVGFIARRLVGKERGYALAGTLGGMLSSTSVTLTYARLSRNQPDSALALAAGTLGANVMLFPRVLLATALLAWPLTQHLWPAFIAPVLVASILGAQGLRAARATVRPSHQARERNPLQVRAALEMAALFQIVLFGVAAATRWFGQAGAYGVAAVMGLADMDAITVSMSALVNTGTPAIIAARAVTIGILSNTVVKFLIALVVGRGRFRSLTTAGLAAIAITLAAALWADVFTWGR
jgi:uncharacterized membrane protein (DUF4010 family)